MSSKQAPLVTASTEEIDRIVSTVRYALAPLEDVPETERIAALNRVRDEIARLSPFCDPVDRVRWVPADRVQANDYNPNAVASPEMRLLELSIREDGYTQPIVVAPDGDQYVVVDGFHRNRVGKEIKDIRQRVFGHLPVVILDKDAGSRMASTIRHNRARGKHQVDLMGELVRELVQKGWPDNKIAKHLGMSVEELLRLKQIVGIAKLLGTPEYSKSWGDINEEGYAPDPVQ